MDEIADEIPIAEDGLPVIIGPGLAWGQIRKFSREKQAFRGCRTFPKLGIQTYLNPGHINLGIAGYKSRITCYQL
jgi:hypothetical protein